MECKGVHAVHRKYGHGRDLIETLWNVKWLDRGFCSLTALDLIETLWNVKNNVPAA